MKASSPTICVLAYLNLYGKRAANLFSRVSMNTKEKFPLELGNGGKNLKRPLLITAFAFFMIAFPRIPAHAGPTIPKGYPAPGSTVPSTLDPMSSDNICVHCHDAHDSQANVSIQSNSGNMSRTALWNRHNLKSSEYSLFSSALDGKVFVPLLSSSTLRCLGCHDGVTATAPGGENAGIMGKLLGSSLAMGYTEVQGDVSPFSLTRIAKRAEMSIEKAACLFSDAGVPIRAKCSTCHGNFCQRWQAYRNGSGTGDLCGGCHDK